MKGFDLIDAASFGYQTVWRERAYLLRLALIPVVIKLACTVAIFVLGYESNYLRQGLVSLPAALAEGWLLAQFLRTLLLLERWPIMLTEEPSESKLAALLLRARGIMSSTILYALITFLAYGLKEVYALFYHLSGAEEGASGEVAARDGHPLMFIPAIALLLASLWMFRLLWLYIPVVVLMPVRDFLKKLGGFKASFPMIGVFLISMIPCFMLAIILSNIFTALLGGSGTDIGSFVIMTISVLMETLVSLITTASMAYALRTILPHHPAALPDMQKE